MLTFKCRCCIICFVSCGAAKQFDMQEWRNWQTRTVQVRVTIAVMRVQVPFPAFYINDAANNLIRRNGGIGRRARFRSVWLLQSWGFKSLFLHHWNQQRISADFFAVKRKIGILTIYLFLREQWNISFYKYNHSLDTCNNFSHLCFLLFAMFYKYNHFLNTCNE